MITEPRRSTWRLVLQIFFASSLGEWIEKEKSEDPRDRPVLGLREMNLYPGLLLFAFGVGLVAGLSFGAGYGVAVTLALIGLGLFSLGRRP